MYTRIHFCFSNLIELRVETLLIDAGLTLSILSVLITTLPSVDKNNFQITVYYKMFRLHDNRVIYFTLYV